MTAQIVADVLLKTDGVTRGVSQVTGRLRGLASSTGSVFKGILGSAAVVKGLDLISDGVGKVVGEFGRVKEAGSNLQQSTGAVEAVFGKYTAGIKRSASQASQALGLSKNEYQELASVVGAGLKNKGIKDYAGETKKLLGLGGDLAAQFGGSTKEAVEAISSLMRGETDPIERYGVSINETAISAELAARGQSKLKGAALEQAKAQARVALLMRQTKDAQGAFARESNTLAGIQQRNAAEWENIRAKLGTALLPVFVASAKVMQSTVIPAVSAVSDWLGANLPGAIKAAQAVITPLVQGFAALAKLIFKGDYTSALRNLFGWTEDSSIVDKILTIREAVVGFFQQIPSAAAGAKSALSGYVSAVGGILRQVAGLVAGVLPTVLSIFSTVAGVVRTQLPVIIGSLSSLIGGIGALFAAVFPIVQQVFGAILQAVQSSVPQLQSAYASIASIVSSIGSIIGSIAERIKLVWSTIGPYVLPIITSVFKTVIAVISGALGIVAGLFKVISSVMKGDWSGAWQGIKQIVTSVLSVVVAVVKNSLTITRTLLSGALAAIKALWSAAWKAVSSVVSSTWSKIKSLVSTGISLVKTTVTTKLTQIKTTWSTAWESVKSKVKTKFDEIKKAVSTKIGEVKTKIKAKLDEIKGLFSADTLKAAGRKLIGGLVSGVREKIGDAVDAVKAGLRKIKDLLPGSPIKDGPLKSWNNGGAGKRLMALVAAGIQDGSGAVQRSMEDALQPPRVNLSGLLTDASTASRKANSGASNTTYVTVKLDVPVGASGVEIGRTLADYLKQYGAATGQRVVVA